MCRSAKHQKRRLGVPILLYAHPFELALGLALLLSGFRALLSGQASPSVNAALPELPLVVFQAVSLLAGIGVLTGLVLREHAFGRTLERSALWLAAGNLGGYGLILATSGYPLTITWDTLIKTAGFAIACILRAVAIRKTELTILRALRAANRAEDREADLIRRIVDSRAIDQGGE